MSTPAPPAPLYSSYVVVLATYDEEARIERAIRYYRRFARVIVVDNFSADRTPDIARGLSVELVSYRNRGTPQSPDWFRFVAGVVPTEYFAAISCSEFIPASVMAVYDEVARARSADVVSCPRRSHTGGELLLAFWGDAWVERFFGKEGLDYGAIAIHQPFAPKDPARRLRLPGEERYYVEHLRDFDAATLMRKHADYAAVEAADLARAGRPPGPVWLLRALAVEVVRFLRVSPTRWSMTRLRESWARAVMHTLTAWTGWELRTGHTISDSRARNVALWEQLVATRGHAGGAPGDASTAVDRAAP